MDLHCSFPPLLLICLYCFIIHLLLIVIYYSLFTHKKVSQHSPLSEQCARCMPRQKLLPKTQWEKR
jgi:hypothetical protein